MKLGIFGGTFDPIHNAHVAVARTVREAFHLDRILLIPNAMPPHKDDTLTAPFADRLAMVRLAVQNESGLEGSDAEAGTGRSYSIHTIEKVLSSLSSSDQLYFIIGADAFAEIRTWYRWQDVLSLVTFIVVARPGHTWVAPSEARVLRLDSMQLEVSSSAIRERLSVCEQPPELPPSVFEYICTHKLYGFGSACRPYPQTPLAADPVSG